MNLGETDYRLGGLERLQEASLLKRNDSLAGCVYLGGRAVEGLLRAVIWRADSDIKSGRKSLETGHDLRDLLKVVVDLGVLEDEADRVELFESVQYVARLWFRNMRFVSSKGLRSHWWQRGEIDRKRSLKMAVAEYYESCAFIVKRREAVCRR